MTDYQHLHTNTHGPELMRAAEIDSMFYVKSWSEKQGRWITQAEHKDAAAAIADCEGWYGEKPPCDCIERDGRYWIQQCGCGNSGDLASAQAWCTERNQA